MANPERLLIIGIDGADHGAVARWVGQGHLPHLRELVSGGRLVRCRSTRPALSAPAWTTALTGCNPGQHGLYDFLDFSYPERRPWWTLPRRCPSLWRRLSDAGLRCGALNVPLTFPAEQLNGVLVSGFGAPDLGEQAFYPPSLRQEFFEALPDYSLQPRLERGNWPDAATLIRYAHQQAQAAAWLLDTHQLDVFMVVFTSLDWAGHAHACPGGERVLLQVMQTMDGHLGDLMRRANWPATPVLVLSDHGMRCAQRQVNLPKLFVDLGLLSVVEASGAPVRASGASRLIRAWNAAKRVLPERVISWLRSVGHERRAAALASGPQVRVDWEHTVAAPFGAYGCVRLNVRGRDPQGIVDPDEYLTVRGEIIERLREATDPAAGEPLFAEVLSRDDLYRGPAVPSGPDIVLVEQREDLAFGAATAESELMLFLGQPRLVAPLVPPCGVHGDHGILLLSGEAAAEEGGAEECSLRDVMPTVLHLLGLPVPSYMDGSVLDGLLSGEAAARPVHAVEETLPEAQGVGTAYSPEEEQQLLERLRGLGYC